MAMTCTQCNSCGDEEHGEICCHVSLRNTNLKRAPEPVFNQSGSKYLREVTCHIQGKVDVYAVLEAFNVTCPARQHAIKKLLCTGLRGKGDSLQDLKECRDAVTRAIQMEEARTK